MEIYSHLCLTDITVKTALLESGPRPFSLSCLPPWGGLCDVSTTEIGANLVSDILIETRVQLVAEKLTAPRLAFACSCTQGTSSYYTLIGRGTTAELDCTSATRALVIRSYTDDSTGRVIYSPEFFSLILILFLDYDYRLIDSTDCDKSRLTTTLKAYIHRYISDL